MALIDRIKKIMEKKGISAYKLEKDIGIKQATFSKWTKGSQPSADKIEQLLNYLQVTPNELFGYNEYIELKENEKELLKAFNELPEREQIKEIGRMEEKAEKYRGTKTDATTD